MTGVELTRRVPCATCGGSGKRYAGSIPGKLIEIGFCPDCTDGTTRVAVSCASCKWWLSRGDGFGYCAPVGTNARGDFGCVVWTAKEGTDGR